MIGRSGFKLWSVRSMTYILMLPFEALLCASIYAMQQRHYVLLFMQAAETYILMLLFEASIMFVIFFLLIDDGPKVNN